MGFTLHQHSKLTKGIIMLNINLQTILKSGNSIARDFSYRELLETEYVSLSILKQHLDEFLLPTQRDTVYARLGHCLNQERPTDCINKCDPIFSFSEVSVEGYDWCVMSHYFEKTSGYRLYHDNAIAFRIRRKDDLLYFCVDNAFSFMGFRFLESDKDKLFHYDYHEFSKKLINIRKGISGKKLELLDAFFERIRPASVATKFNAALRFTYQKPIGSDAVEITAYLNGRVSQRISIEMEELVLQ